MAQPNSLAAEVAAQYNRRDPRNRVRTEVVHPSHVNRIVQVRPHYDPATISQLGVSMATTGQIELPVLAELGLDAMRAYVEFFNQVLGGSSRPEQVLAYPKTGRFLLAVSGNRRTLAATEIYTTGCATCRERAGGPVAGGCAKRHDRLVTRGMEVRVFPNLEPEQALAIQIAENTKEEIPAEAQAFALRASWEIARRQRPGLTVGQFARSRNQDPTKTAQALRFCLLPDSVRRVHRGGMLSFGAAVELARLTADGVAEEAVLGHMQHLIASRRTTKQAAVYVTAVLKSRTAPAQELEMQLDDTESTVAVQKSALRTKLLAADRARQALVAVDHAAEEGVIPTVDALTSPEVRRALRTSETIAARLRRSRRQP